MSQKFLNPVEVDGQVSAEYLDLSTITTHSVNAGEIAWNSVDGTFDIGLLNGVILQAGQEIHFYGKATEAISNGDAVQFAGVQGDHLLIKKAVASEINANPEYFMGIATQDFSNNQFGYVTAFGNVRGLNTASYNLGEILYFNSASLSVPGLLTSTKPTAPNAKIEVAAVVRVHGTQGILMVRPHVMPKVSDIQDVDINTVTLTQNSGIFWNQLTSRFENKSIVDALGYTPANASGTSSYLSKFTSSTTLGDSQVFDNGTNVLIGTTTDEAFAKLVISGGNVLIDNNRNFVTKRADGLVLSMLKVNTSNQLEFNPLYGQGVTGYIFGINGASKMSMNTSGDVTAISSFRTPTFYDSDNTSYYLNAAGSSNLYNVTANSFVKSGGTSSQFLKADGSVDSNTYLTSVTNIFGYSGTLISEDNRTISPSELGANRLKFGFTSWANNSTLPYADFIHLRSYQNASGGSDNLIMFKKSGIGMRIWQQTYGSSTAYSTFKDVAFTDSDISGNAATATTLQTTRTINGTNFNGSANIETSYWGATRTLTIGNTGKSVNGSGNVSWTLAEIGAYAATNPNGYTSNTGTVTSVSGTGSYGGLTLSGTVTGSGNITFGGTPTGTWPISISGNATTATSADNIDGIAFRNGNSTNSINPDSITENGIGHVNSVSLFGQTDGALYSQAYSSVWNHQIFGDYRTGQLAVRGRNNGTLTAWRTILDSSNFTSYAASTSHTHTFDSLTSKTSGTGTYQTSGDFRAPIFYDSNNTGYYVDPASTSNLNGLVVNSEPTFQTSTLSKYIQYGYISGSINNYTSKRIGQPSDYNRFVVLLHPVYNGSLIAYYECDGTFTKRRGATVQGLTTGNYRVQTKTGYTSNAYSIVSSIGGNGDLYTCTYNGVKYVCLVPDYTTSGCEIGFDGYINGDANALSVIPYYNTNTSTVLNSEINSSLAIVSSSSQNRVNFRPSLASDTDIRTPIFYDSNNTNYYANPAGISNFSTILGVSIQVQSTSPSLVIQDTDSSGAAQVGFISFRNNGGTETAWTGFGGSSSTDFGIINTLGRIYLNGTYTEATSSLRAPIFYDSNNTTYYFDGASTGDSIRCAGDIVAYYSDERLKDKKGNIKNALEKVLSLNGFYYEPNKKAQELGYKKKLEVGVSAQEVEAILPEIIKDAPIGQGYKTLDYGKLTPLLIEAIKEQQKQIDELKELVNKLITK